ncbi:MAG: HAD family hydrolase [Candidatus Uhrbacteria bacterium]
MPNGHNGHLGVEVVCFDAMFTLIEPRGTKDELLTRILHDEAGFRITPAELAEVIQGFRRAHPRAGEDMSRYWPRMNRILLHQLGVKGNLWAIARRMHDRVLTDVNLYEVRADMRSLLQWASAENIAIAMVSNQRHRTLRRLLQELRINRHFVGRVLTSSRMQHPKPSRRFFVAVSRALSLRHMRQMALVGNSIENDAPATMFGIRVAILDRSGALFNVSALQAGVTPVRSPVEVREWITLVRNHQPEKCEEEEGESCVAIAGSR